MAVTRWHEGQTTRWLEGQATGGREKARNRRKTGVSDGLWKRSGDAAVESAEVGAAVSGALFSYVPASHSRPSGRRRYGAQGVRVGYPGSGSRWSGACRLKKSMP
jgi:hypothetical protein